MEGTQIGQLSVERRLGAGGMGEVYLARHRVLGSQWVVKVLLPHLSHNPEMVQRFINEGRAASAVKHPSVIEVGDCDQLPNGSWYVVMKYLEGINLLEFMHSNGMPLSSYQMIDILAGVAAALDEVHAVAVVHRDLKPENIQLIKLDDNPLHPVVLDFGLAKLHHQLSGVNTAVGMIAGTIGYVAPEQLHNFSLADHRADIYSLGVIAYQMLTGRYPFQPRKEGDHDPYSSPVALYNAQQTTLPIDPREFADKIPDGVAHAVLAALQFDPSRRPQSAGSFIRMIGTALPGDAFQLNGTDIIRKRARKILSTNNLLETVRAPKQAPRFKLGERLGCGGMAEVFRGTMAGAEDWTRVVAIKRVLPNIAGLPRFGEMFIAEAKLVSRLRHPNIVSVVDFARDQDGLFLVMEFVDGPSLDQLMDSGPVPVPAAIFIVTEILRGLGYAHSLPDGNEGIRGVIHRDVSPHNVLISTTAAVMLSDFGIAKTRDATEVSETDHVRGKIRYMSPEQALGARLDTRADLFSVGVILWELLAQRPLFSEELSRGEVERALVHTAAPRPSTVRRVPSDVETVAMTLLARDPQGRFATAEDAIAALSGCKDAPVDGRGELLRLLRDRAPSAQPDGKAASDRTGATVSDKRQTSISYSASEATAIPRRAPTGRMVALGVAGVLAVAATSYGIVRSFRRGPVASTQGVVMELDAGTPTAELPDARAAERDAAAGIPDAVGGVGTTTLDAALTEPDAHAAPNAQPPVVKQQPAKQLPAKQLPAKQPPAKQAPAKQLQTKPLPSQSDPDDVIGD